MPKQTYKLLRFDGGINNDADPRDIEDKQFADLQNVAVDEVGKIIVLGDIKTTHHSIAAAITAHGTGLKAVKTDYDGLAAGSADVGGRTYYITEKAEGITIEDSDGSEAETGFTITDLSEANMYYVDGALRIYDGDHSNAKTNSVVPTWRGYIPGVLYGTVDSDGGRFKGHIWNSGGSKADQWYTKKAQITGCFPEATISGTDSHTGAHSVGINLIMGSEHCGKNSDNYTATGDHASTYTGGEAHANGEPADVFAFADETCATGSGPTAAPGNISTESGMYWGFGMKYNERGNESGSWMPNGDDSYQFWCTTIYDEVQESLPQLFTMYPAGPQAASQGGGTNNQNFGPVDQLATVNSYISAAPETSLQFGSSDDRDVKGTNIALFFNPTIKMCSAQWDDTTNFTGSGDSLAISGINYNFGADNVNDVAAGSGNPRITALRVYWSSNEDGFNDKWLLFEYNFTKGVKSYGSTAGSGGGYSRNDWSGHGTPLDTHHYWYQHTHGNSGGAYGIEFEHPPKFIRYNAANGHDSDDIIIVDSFKSSVIANGRVYLGNVQIDGKIYSDRMLKSGYHLDGSTLDKFPVKANNIDVIINDGDEIIALAEYADRILQFKRNTCYIINISGASEYLEAEYKFKGVTNPGAICRTDYGLAWVNQNGCYWYNGESVEDLLEDQGLRKINQSTWSTFIDDDNYHRIGFNPFKRQLIVLQGTTGDNAYIYDMITKSWTFSTSMIASGSTKSNFINDPTDGKLLIHDGTSTIDKWSDDPNSATPTISITTKDIDFGEPAIRKKVYKAYISYKSGSTCGATISYGIDGGTIGAASPTSGASLSTSQSAWTTHEVIFNTNANSCKSIQLKISGAVDKDFAINDISFIYRRKGIK